jgi:hypothetical protein
MSCHWDLSWFRKHLGHDIGVLDEYGKRGEGT